MNYAVRLAVLLMCAVILQGCITAKKTTKTSSLDPKTNILTEVTVEESPSMFKSENQEMAFDTMQHKIDKGADVKIKRLDSLDRQMDFIATSSMSNEAKAYASAMVLMVIGQVKEDTVISDIPLPNNATDVILRNPYLANLVIGTVGSAFGVDLPGYYGGGSGSGTSSNNERMTVMGDYYFQSTRKDQYDIDAYATWQDARQQSLSEDYNYDYDWNTDSGNTWGFGENGGYTETESSTDDESFF